MEQSPPLGPRPRLLLQGRALSFRLSPFEILTLLSVLAAATFGGYTAYARATDLNATPVPAPTYLPTFRTTLTSSVSATGSVQSSQQVTLTFGSTGKIKEFLAGLGTQVTAGQALARLDDSDLRQAVRSAETALASTQARYSAVLNPSAVDVASAAQTLASARSLITTAQKNLDDLIAKPLAADIAAAQQGILSAQNSLQSAHDAVTKAQHDLATAENDLRLAQSDLDLAYSTLGLDRKNVSEAAEDCEDRVSIPSLPPKARRPQRCRAWFSDSSATLTRSAAIRTRRRSAATYRPITPAPARTTRGSTRSRRSGTR